MQRGNGNGSFRSSEQRHKLNVPPGIFYNEKTTYLKHETNNTGDIFCRWGRNVRITSLYRDANVTSFPSLNEHQNCNTVSCFV
jgi:hypothetical protein